ncbi:MAG: glutaredoxin family protein [Candidatus Hodarchaeales archaeon]|jgi:transcriptional regulator with GAF, ATPase, and Fis domain
MHNEKKMLNQPFDEEKDSLQNLSIISEFSRNLSRGKRPDGLARALELICSFLDAPYGVIVAKPADSRTPAILAFYSERHPSGYQPEYLEKIVQILVNHIPPFIGNNFLWIKDVFTEASVPKLISTCEKVLSFSLAFETQDLGRVFIFLGKNAKPTDERLAILEILIDILSLYYSQKFSAAQDSHTRIASLRRITNLTSSAHTLDEILRAVNREIKSAIDCRSCWAILPAKNTQYGIVQIRGDQKPAEWSFDQIDQEKIKRWIKKCASPMLLSPIEINQNVGAGGAILSLASSDSSLVIPIQSRNRVLGLFSLILPENLDFMRIWPLIEEIQGPVSAAISNAVLFEEVVQRASETAVLNETAAALTSTSSIDTILSITRRALRTLMGNISVEFDLTTTNDNKRLENVEEETSAIKIPILAQEEFLGSIILKKTDRGKLEDQQVELARLVGYHLAPVLKSAYLFQSERKTKEQLAKSNIRLEKANKEISNLYSNLETLYEQLGNKLAELLEDQIEIVLFTSPDCVHCAAAERITQEALRLYKGQVSYKKVDVLSEKPKWKGRMIKSVPAIGIGNELLFGVPSMTRIHTCLINTLLPLIGPKS